MTPITLHVFYLRLAAVRRNTEDEHAQVFARVNGNLMALNSENFQIDDDGTLLINGARLSAESPVIAATPLNDRELAELDLLLSNLRRFLGSPGDWGHDTRLGRLTTFLCHLDQDLHKPAMEQDA